MHRLLALSVVVFLSAVGTTTAQEVVKTKDVAGSAATGHSVSAEAPVGAASPANAETAPPAHVAVAANAVVPPPPTAVDAGTYDVRLRNLEQRINELKERIFRSKARLSLLAETVLQGVVAGAQSRIVHSNKMGSSYQLVRVVYSLDGAPIFNKNDESGALADQEEFDIYNGSIVPGEHTLTVSLQYRGHGYGIFSYLKGYRFNINSSYTFTAAEGKVSVLRVVGYEKGGPTAPLEERPQLRFLEKLSERDAAPPGQDETHDEEEGGE